MDLNSLVDHISAPPKAKSRCKEDKWGLGHMSRLSSIF